MKHPITMVSVSVCELLQPLYSMTTFLSPPLNATTQRRHHHLQPLRRPITCAALTKQAHRFLTSLSTAAAVAGDPAVSDRLIRKLVKSSSSKSVALNALSHLLSPKTSPNHHLSSLALKLYTEISEADWFNWNPKMLADLVSLLQQHGKSDTADSLISEALSKLGSRERDIAQFYCNLIESVSTRNLKLGFYESYASLNQLVSNSSSIYVKRCGYKSMISSLCEMDSPIEAEVLMKEMVGVKLKPSVFEYRCLVYAYGRLGLFNDMKRCVAQMENKGFELDTVSSNMVISSFGAHGELSEMASWLQRMKNSGIEFSIRTYNSVLNACPMITTMLGDIQNVPISIDLLITSLSESEGRLVQELIDSSVFEGLMEWSSTEGKLDLHGMHLSAAYLVLLQWKEDLKSRLRNENSVIPKEFTVICGLGNHSAKRGESPVKCLVKQMIVRMNCPMRIDRTNVGCFIGKGRALKDWLC